MTNAAIAMADGKTHLGWWQSAARCTSGPCDGTKYATGTEPTNLATGLVPLLDNGYVDHGLPVSIAVDSAGKPALTWFQRSINAGSEYNTAVVFWRPGEAPVRVTDSRNYQNDGPSVALTFFGTQPRIAMHLSRGDTEESGDDLKVSASEDGKTWAEPVTLRRDAKDSTDWYQSIAVDSKGNAAVVGNHNTSEAGASGQCGGPKLIRSNEKFEGWFACGLEPTGKASPAGKYVKAAFTEDDRLVVFQQPDTDDDLIKPGIVLLREE